jgi:EAL domain-containing protein (putative c-di-GMP-specific phosphodiesterase class I)
MSNNFNEFVFHVEKGFSDKNISGSLLQLTLRNYDQLCTILDKNDIEKLDVVITRSINKVLDGTQETRIYEYNKFYYLAIDETDEIKVSKISSDIHDIIISDPEIKYLLDVRIVGAKITKNNNLSEVIMLLADKIHYTDSSQIFCYISDPIFEIEKIKHDYSLLRELKESINSGSACFAFQPVVCCDSKQVVYHECLLRLSDKDYKLISAGKYIMLAEKYGFITFVDKYVFEMVIRELKQSENIIFSVNISNIGVSDRTLTDYILNLISLSGKGNRLIIEITETSMNNNYENTKKFVNEAKKLGCKIALDDFGAGYNSFNQIREFSIDILKIDGSYIKDLDTNPKNQILVETLIKTANDLGCKTAAEFVERGSIAKDLLGMGVDYMQGNFFSPAINYRSWKKI